MSEATADRSAREVRIALVLNGGVSLAVWMGGVTHEIDLLRRASRVACGEQDEADVAVAGYDRPVFEQWVALCRRANLGRVVVDVVAGTSAGGLNGTLLATAVARGVPLDPVREGATCPRLREIWDSSARLEAGYLLRKADGKPLASVLDGGYFHQRLREVVGEIGDDGGARTPDPMTLFVTSTALGPASQRFVDSFGRRFDVADHRRLYRFRRTEPDRPVFRPGDGGPEQWWRTGEVADDDGAESAFVDDFDRADADAGTALATAARASASFPVAFEPVQEGTALARRRILPAAKVDAGGTRWLVDGGVLDNAPFQPVLDAITRRPATGPVRRLLVYIVPSRGVAGGGLDQAQSPANDGYSGPAWKSVVGSAIDFPREGDVRDDIEYAQSLLAEGEAADVDTLRQVGPEALFAAEVESPGGAADGLFGQFRRARALGGLRDVRAVLSRAQEGGGVVLAPYPQTGIDRLLALDLPWVPPDGTPLEGTDGPWLWGLGTAERVCRTLARDLRSRSVGADAVRPVAQALSRVEAVRDAVDALLTADAATAPGDDVALVGWAAQRFTTLRVREALAFCVRSAAEGYAAARGWDAGRWRGIVGAGLTVEVATQAFSAYRLFRRTAPFEFLRLGPDVESPFVDVAGRAADQVAGAVEEARRRGDRKLYGTRVDHFAAFGLTEWRAWDWTAGRLDAQTHLARALTGSDVPRAAGAPEGNGSGGGGPEELLPWLSDVQRRTVHAELGLEPAAWAQRREALYATTDATLIADLRRQPAGTTMLAAVQDALMRSLPHPRALDRTGGILNAVLAPHPQHRFVPLWAPLARIPGRLAWKRVVARLGAPGRENAKG